MASKQRNDIDVMIEVLEEAALRSIDAEPPGDKQRIPQELRSIMDLMRYAKLIAAEGGDGPCPTTETWQTA